LPSLWWTGLLFACSPSARRSAGTVATHKHPVQAAMLAVIVIEAGFMQRGAIIDDQQVALFILVRIRVRPSEDSLRGLAERLVRAKRPIPPRSDRRQQRIAD
jgi:hypothetical protein